MNQFGRYAGPYRKSSANSCSTVGIPSPGASQILEDENLQKPIMDYLSGFDVDDQPLQESHLLKWIEKRGPIPPPDHAHGYPQDVAGLWGMQQSLDVAKTELHKLQRTYDTQSVQIDKVKAAQMNKLSPGATFGADELEKWKMDKLNPLLTKIRFQENSICELNTKLVDANRDFLKKLLVGPQDDWDPECDELMAELESVIAGSMSDVVVTPNESDDKATLDATSLALEHVQALPDGPQKSALFAVLQSVAPNQVGKCLKNELVVSNHNCFKHVCGNTKR